MSSEKHPMSDGHIEKLPEILMAKYNGQPNPVGGVWGDIWIKDAANAITQLRNQRDRLHAIVERLPVTADGVPIYAGMTIWFVFDFAPERITSTTVHKVMMTPEYSEVIDIKSTILNHTNWFSTREAAEAARNAKETTDE